MDERWTGIGFQHKRRTDERNWKDVYRGIPVYGNLHSQQAGLLHCICIHGAGKDTAC